VSGATDAQIAEQLGTRVTRLSMMPHDLPNTTRRCSSEVSCRDHEIAPSRPHDGIECPPDQLGRARLRQHLDGHILGHEIALDQLAHEIRKKSVLRSGRKPDFDLLEASLTRSSEHTALSLGTPMGSTSAWLPVAQIDAATR